MSNSYPNVRGTAGRHGNKEIRVGTHLSVIRDCVINTDVTHIIEHGMGLSSTTFFHKLNPLSILSFENVPEWRDCQTCRIDKEKLAKHRIVEFSSESYVHEIESMAVEPAKTLALVDGPGSERFEIMSACMSLGIIWIIEHDAETFIPSQIDERRQVARELGYNAWQFIELQPESVLYATGEPAFVQNKKRYVVL